MNYENQAFFIKFIVYQVLSFLHFYNYHPEALLSILTFLKY